MRYDSGIVNNTNNKVGLTEYHNSPLGDDVGELRGVLVPDQVEQLLEHAERSLGGWLCAMQLDSRLFFVSKR